MVSAEALLADGGSDEAGRPPDPHYPTRPIRVVARGVQVACEARARVAGFAGGGPARGVGADTGAAVDAPGAVGRMRGRGTRDAAHARTI